MFWAALGNLLGPVLGDHPKLLCQQCLEQLQVHQSMLWATVQNCFKYTKIQGRACSGLQSLFPKLLQVHKNMFWATILNCFKQVLGDHTKLLRAGGVTACLKHAWTCSSKHAWTCSSMLSFEKIISRQKFKFHFTGGILRRAHQKTCLYGLEGTDDQLQQC